MTRRSWAILLLCAGRPQEALAKHVTRDVFGKREGERPGLPRVVRERDAPDADRLVPVATKQRLPPTAHSATLHYSLEAADGFWAWGIWAKLATTGTKIH